MKTCARSILPLLFIGLLLVPGEAAAQLFDETTISFSFADDNVLRDPGETRKNSPDAYFGGQSATSLDRVGGTAFEQTATRLVVGKKLDTGTVFPDGALKLRFNAGLSGDYSMRDDGSYIALNIAATQGLLLKLAMFPVDSDRFRLGYHYDISWGGSNTFPKNFRKGLVPGLKLSLEHKRFEAFLGAKSALIRSPSQSILDNPGGNTNQFVERAYYAILGGGHVEIVEGLKLHLGAAYFEKGTNTRANVLGKKIDAWGFGGTISFGHGGAVGRRLDLRHYYQDPEQFSTTHSEAAYAGEKLGFQIAFEANFLGQVLEDPDLYASTTREWSKAFCLSTGVRYDKVRLFLDFVYRDLSYIVYNVPGFVPYQALPESASLSHGGGFSFLPQGLSGEWFGVLSGDYFFELGKSYGITPALSVGFLLPATYQAGADGLGIEGPYAAEHAKGTQKVVVRGSHSGDWGILPAGEDELAVWILKFDLKFTISRYFALIGEVSYAHDPNYAQVLIDPHGHAVREFDSPDILGFGLVSELAF